MEEVTFIDSVITKLDNLRRQHLKEIKQIKKELQLCRNIRKQLNNHK